MTIDGYIQPEDLEHQVYKKLTAIGITDNDYPINPYALIKNEGIILLERAFSNAALKGVIMYGSEATAIAVNSNRCFVSKRFAAMHELIHFWFHPRINENICIETYKEDYADKEWQANNAAAYALMPKDIVLKLFATYDGDIHTMSNILKVSSESLKYRIKELGLRTTQRRYFSFYNNPDPGLIALENSFLYGGL